MGFKLKSGNKVSFKNMGSSPAKQVEIKGETNYSERLKGAQDAREAKNDYKYEGDSKSDIKQTAKTSRQKARGGDTIGGREVTKTERSEIRDAKLASKLERAEGLKAEGKGEKGFSWKEAGMSVLRGEGLLGNIAAGIGKGRDKSDIIKDKQARIAGREEREGLRATQKAARKAKRVASRKKIEEAGDLDKDIIEE